MPIVKMPDGQLVEMPDNPDPELLKRFSEHVATLQPKIDNSAPIELPGNEPSTMDRLAAAHNKAMPEMVDIANTGLKKGILGLSTLGWDTGKTLAKLTKDYLPSIEAPAIVGKVRDSIDEYLHPKDPETNTGKVFSNLIASASGGALGPGNAGANAAMGLSGGMGAELLAKVLPDNALTRIAGSLLGSGIHGIATQEFKNSPRLARELRQGVSDEELLKAAEVMRNSKKQGFSITLDQAMDKPSNIDTYVSALANSEQGKTVAEALRKQPLQTSLAMEHQVKQLPGELVAPHTMANRVQGAATEVLKNANSKATETWTNTFNEAAKSAGKEVPEDTVKSVAKGILDMRSNYAQKDSEYKVLTQLANRFAETNPTTKQPEFITDAAKLHRTLRDFKSTLTQENLANKGLSTSVDKFIGGVVNDVKTKLGESLEPYAKANAAYANAKQSVNALKQSEIGRLAGRRGAIPGVEATMAPIHNLFAKGTIPGTPSEILHTAKEFTKVGKGEDFVDAGKNYFVEAISKAGASNNNRVNDNIAENITKVFGVPAKLDARSQGTKDILVGMAIGKGIKEADSYAEGFQRLMNTVARVARRPGTVSGTSKAAIDQAAEESMFKRLGQFSFLTPIRQPALRWSMYLKDDSLTAINKMLTDPDQVANLILLGKQPTMNQTAQKSIMAILSANQAAHHSNLEGK